MNGDTALIITGWINKAEKDIKTIEHEFQSSDPVYDSICFHAQQALKNIRKHT